MLKRLIKQISLAKKGGAFLLISSGGDAACLLVRALVKELEIKNPDVFFINPESSIKINDVREIKKFLALKPHSSQYKIVMVDLAEKLTSEAANALLKILEETPPNSFIFLAVHDKSQLLATVVSRCQIVRLKPTRDALSESQMNAISDDLHKIAKMPISEKFILAKNISEKKDAANILTEWLHVIRKRIVADEKSRKIAKKMLDAEKIMENPSINKRLLFENLLLLI